MGKIFSGHFSEWCFNALLSLTAHLTSEFLQLNQLRNMINVLTS